MIKLNTSILRNMTGCLQSKLAELKEAKYSLYYLQVHMANKVTLLLVVLLILFCRYYCGQVDIGYIIFGF